MSTLTAALEVLQSGDFHARWDAAKALAGFGEQAIAPLAQLLQSPDSDVELQWVAARALGDFQHPDALMALATSLCTTEDDEISEIAAETLGSMGAAAIPILEDYLQSHQTTLPAIQALAHIRDAKTIPLLLQAAQQERAEIRAAAMEALSAFHRPQVVPALIQGLSDLSPQVRQIAVMGLGYRPQEPLDWMTLVQPLLHDDSLQVSQQTALTLGRLGLTQPLLNHLKTDCSVALKRTVIQALGRVGNRQALQHLRQAFQLAAASESWDLARGVIDEIATLQTQQPLATQMLLEILEQPQPMMILNAIATALGQLRQPEAMEALIQLLAQPDLGVRLHAIAALKQLQNCNVHQHLQTLANNPEVTAELTTGVTLALQEW
ncbi:HEAT repeat domain-containing protein [Acaryochloris thomasi]|nr:HEAT repeat domain-containing protein [Acaryochloris thomasi]